MPSSPVPVHFSRDAYFPTRLQITVWLQKMTVVSPAVPYARRGRHSACPTPTPGTLVPLPVMDRLRGLGSAGAVASEALPGRRCGTFLARVGGGGREIAVRTPRSGSWAAMRYNEKELQALSRQPAELAAELGMRGPKKGSGEWGRGCEPGTGRTGVPVGAGWAVAEPARARPVSTVVKRRLVKLVVNFLFYFRTDEAEVGRREGGPRVGVGELGSPDGPPIRLVCPQPVGALLLEHCRVTQEEPSGFSISECGGRGPGRRGPELRSAPPHRRNPPSGQGCASPLCHRQGHQGFHFCR